MALSSTKLSVNTCINKADRQGIQLRPVKSVFIRIDLRYRYNNISNEENTKDEVLLYTPFNHLSEK